MARTMIKSCFNRATVFLLTAFAVLASSAPLQAAQWIYEYRVKHPQYGDVGTYTNVIDQSGSQTSVRTSINVQVRFLGMVVYRQEAQRHETWRGGRLAAFQGTTVINGTRTEVRGEAQDNNFV